MTTIDEAQREVRKWVTLTFGPQYLNNPRERAFRVLEEAAELAQSLGLTEFEAYQTIKQVFVKPVELNVGKELAGTFVCTLAAACVDLRSLDLEYNIEREWRWNNQELIRQKHAKKTAVAIQGGYTNG